MTTTKIYVLTVYAKDGRIYDLGFSTDINDIRSEIDSDITKECLKELKIDEVEKYEIRDNYFPRTYYPLGD